VQHLNSAAVSRFHDSPRRPRSIGRGSASREQVAQVLLCLPCRPPECMYPSLGAEVARQRRHYRSRQAGRVVRVSGRPPRPSCRSTSWQRQLTGCRPELIQCGLGSSIFLGAVAQRSTHRRCGGRDSGPPCGLGGGARSGELRVDARSSLQQQHAPASNRNDRTIVGLSPLGSSTRLTLRYSMASRNSEGILSRPLP